MLPRAASIFRAISGQTLAIPFLADPFRLQTYAVTRMKQFHLSQRVLPVFLIAFLLMLTGCDASDPTSDQSEDIIGTWTLQSSASYAIVSTSETDRVPGADPIGDGITVDGVDLPFKYMEVYESGLEDGQGNRLSRTFELNVFTDPGGSGGNQEGPPACMLTFEYHEQLSASFSQIPEPYVRLSCTDAITGEYDEAWLFGEGLFTYDPEQWVLTLSPDLVLSDDDPGLSPSQERRIRGSLAFPITPVPAGTPTRVTGRTGLDAIYSLDLFPSDTSVEYLEDGTYRSSYTAPPNLGLGSGLIEETGSWSTDGETLTMQAESINGARVDASTPVSFAYMAQSGELDLELAVDPCESNRSCLDARGSALRLRNGQALESLTQGVTAQFSRDMQ